MPNYKNGKIYKITSCGLTYFGSTCMDLQRRLQVHKYRKQRCSSNILFNNDDVEIILVEDYPCSTKEELLLRERYYIENNACINIQIPIREEGEAIKVYRENNREKLRIKNNICYAKNKDKYNEKFDCECGGKYAYQHKKRHSNSKKHLSFVKNLKKK